MSGRHYQVTAAGRTIVDPGKLLASEKVRKTLRDADRLYELLKAKGYKVQKVGDGRLIWMK